MDAAKSLIEMAMGYSRSRIVCAAARLGVADALGCKECTVEDLAKRCSADRDSLYRLLRALASIGFTRETSPGVFVLTEFGQPLRRDAPNSAWPAVVFWADLLADSWSYLPDCIRQGTTAASVMEGQGIESRWAKDPDAGAIFRAVMGSGPADDFLPIVNAWSFGERNVIADLGGGGGGLIRAILKSHSKVQGMLVDRPASIESAVARIEAEGLSSRCKLIGADLQDNVPGGADVYILKHVLHGYRDDVALKILNRCHDVVPTGGCLLVIEAVLPDVVGGPDPTLEKRLMSDLNMLAVTGGKERSEIEWRKLLQAAKLTLDRVIPISGGMKDLSILEASLSSRVS